MNLDLRLMAALLVVLVVVSTPAPVIASDDGPKRLGVGDYCDPFDVQVITGPKRGKTLCYI